MRVFIYTPNKANLEGADNMEKYGFVYLWYDKKRKMYYVGCHWGRTDDGYICSSKRMRESYKRRPHDFKRRILKTNIGRDVILEEEFKWLSLIDDSELGKKYYNHSKRHFGHWSNADNRQAIVNKIMGNKNRLGKMKTPEECEKISKSLTGRKRSPESIEKQRMKLIGRKLSQDHIDSILRGKRISRLNGRKHKSHYGRVHSDATKEKMSRSIKSSPKYKAFLERIRAE